VPFVPAPWSILADRQAKLRQLSLAGRLGFAIPPTLVTNDPSQFLAFYREQEGRCITKHLSTKSLFDSGLLEQFVRYTEPVTHRDLRSLGAIRLCPVLVQGYVPKQVELRVTVVGERVFAAEIHSQAAAHTAHDWRRHHAERAPCLVHALPDEVAQRCLRMTAELGLRYGAVDLILTPDGEYVFLEINPGGEYHWIEVYTGLPITQAICALLIELADNISRQRSAPCPASTIH
jgi:glutathione synthase/RimK-type ligase-like ATP-grasp enzyme